MAPVKINAYPLPTGDGAKLGFSARALGYLDTLIASTSPRSVIPARRLHSRAMASLRCFAPTAR